MKFKLAAVCSITLLACAAASAPAFAGQLDWNFLNLAGSSGPLGPTATFSQSGQTLTASSYSAGPNGCTIADGSSCTWSAGGGNLYVKDGGSLAEDGLGLQNDPTGDYEIYAPYGIMVNLPTGTYATDVTIGSLQGNSTSGEGWAVYGSNNGNSWDLLGYGQGGLTEDFNSSSLMGYSQLIISEPLWDPFSNNDLLTSVTTNSMNVPEPGTLALFGAGLLGCGLLISRRRRARQS